MQSTLFDFAALAHFDCPTYSAHETYYSAGIKILRLRCCNISVTNQNTRKLIKAVIVIILFSLYCNITGSD